MKNYFFLALVLSLSISAYAETYTVSRVIDSATLELTDGQVVRLIGLDPSAGGRAQEAAGFVRNIVEDWDQVKVRLEFDVQQQDQDGRLLAYVYLYQCALGCMVDADVGYSFRELDDGVYLFLNETILAAGYGMLMALESNVKYADLFEKAYQNAKEQKWGLWNKPTSRLNELLNLSGPEPRKNTKNLTDYLDRGMIKIKNDF